MFSKFSGVLLYLILLLLIIQPFVVHSLNLKSKIEYFKNFQNLKDSTQEGNTMEGLSEVKQYLQNYGYYRSHIVELNNNFDEPLTFALQTYQKTYHLNVTGTLNFATVKQMMMSRCGYPDIINHYTSNKNLHNTEKLHDVDILISNYNFYYRKPKWPSYDLTYRFLGQQVVDPQVLRDVCSRAFKRWSDVSRFTFREASQGVSASNILISFRTFDGVGRRLAYANAPTDGNLYYDSAESWSTNPGRYEIDLESLTVHEIGHLLGLDHSQYSDAIMYPIYAIGSIKRELRQDDINGIDALYH